MSETLPDPETPYPRDPIGLDPVEDDDLHLASARATTIARWTEGRTTWWRIRIAGAVHRYRSIELNEELR